MAFSYIIYLRSNYVIQFISKRFEFKWNKVYQQIKLGFPVGIQEMITMSGFAIFYKIIGMIGVLELAGSEVILNIAHASFMPAVGIGMASAALLGKFLGEKNIIKADETIKYGIKWSLLIMGTMGTMFILFPKYILSIFIINDEIINISIPCLQIIGIVQYFDAIGLTLFFILTGAGNTKFPAFINIGLCWIVFLPLAYLLSIYIEMGLIGAWISFAIWVILYSIIMFLKIKTGSWKNIKV
jgi:putative MATE family efflux protein